MVFLVFLSNSKEKPCGWRRVYRGRVARKKSKRAGEGLQITQGLGPYGLMNEFSISVLDWKPLVVSSRGVI